MVILKCLVNPDDFYCSSTTESFLLSRQVPFCPPKPKVQDPSTVGSTLREDFHCLLTSAAFTDLVLVAGGGPTAGGTIVHAHR